MRISLISLLAATVLSACTNPHDDKSGGNSNEVNVNTGDEAALWIFQGGETIVFSDTEVGTVARRTQVITYNGSEPLTMNVTGSDDGIFTVSVSTLTFTPGGSQAVTVTFAPSAEESYADDIALAGTEVTTSFGVEGIGIITDPDTGTVVDNDDDGDGYDDVGSGGTDCDDGEASTYPGAPDLCDGVDNDCDGADNGCSSEEDADHDGYTPAGGDCDDTSSGVNPGADEACNGINDDCDSETDEGCDSEPSPDSDGDGYSDAIDCDDDSSGINPGATERCDNSVDDDCDGDVDGADSECTTPDTGGEDTGGDTGADTDTGGDTGEDTDSGDTGGDSDTGPSDPDTDGDGDPDSSDCDDSDPAIYTGADEICGNTIDEDCDGSDEVCDDYDADDDGYEGTSGDGSDCDDSDPLVNPAADEVCGDGQDNDCDGGADNLPNLSFVFSAPGDGPQPFSGVTVYGYSDTGTWNCSGSDGPINLSICTDDSSLYEFTDATEIAAYKSDLQAEVDAWVASAPLVDSDGASYSAVEWVTSTNVDSNVCVSVGVQIAAPY